MAFDKNQPRDKAGRWINAGSIKDYKKLENKEIKHYNKSGSENIDKYKGLSEEQIEIVQSFEAINDGRYINEISAIMNNGGTLNDVKNYVADKGYNEKRIEQYFHVTNYMQMKKPYEGEITRLLRDDRGVFESFNVGDEMNFDRLTSFGKEGNDFKIKGGNLIIHISKNTRGIDISNLMPFKEEMEVLVDAGKYKIIDKKEGNKNHIYLEEI